MDEELSRLSQLGEPTRRAIYLHIAGSTDAVSRDDAARAVGISRKLAAFHLEKLLGAGLVEAVYRRLTGRTGPGAGRPAKLYRASAQVGRIRGRVGLLEELAERGYAPKPGADEIVLATCPFEKLVAEHGRVVCEVNRELVERVRVRSGEAALDAILDPAPGRCCVLLRAS
jgi:predicted ArsR family transcriptional regulator